MKNTTHFAIAFIFCLLQTTTYSQFSYNGYAHTPKDHLHVLIVFAARDGIDVEASDDWPVDDIPD